MLRKPLVFLVAIFLLSVVLRFYKLGSLPPSLNWDEVAWGYNAYSLGTDLKDEFGRFLPLDYLESFGDFKPPVYAYLSVLPVKIFGLSEFSVRLASAFFGALTVGATYFLTKQLFKKEENRESLALVASLLLSISPWHILLSRAAFEANVATFLIIFGVLAFLKGVWEKTLPAGRQGLWLILSLMTFALSLMTFNTARFVAPVLGITLLVHFRKKIWQKKKAFLIGVFLSFLILLPTLIFLTTSQSKLRFREVNIFSDLGVIETSNQEVANDNYAWWSKVIHNRRWGHARSFLGHYFDHFNPQFLFISGDGNPKLSSQQVGQFYLTSLPFLVLGILFLLKRKQGLYWFIFLWLLVGIIPAATARETPHALRIETTLPTWQIITAFGLVSFLTALKKKLIFKRIFLVLVPLLFLANFTYFTHHYLFHYTREYANEWQYGYKEAIEFAKKNEAQYDRVYFTNQLGRPYIYFLFYLKKDPAWFREKAVVEREVFGFVKVKSMGKYYFGEKFEERDPNERVLYFDVVDQVPNSARVLRDFYLPNGDQALTAYEF